MTQIDVISKILFLLEFYLNLWCNLILTWISFHIWSNFGDSLKGLEFLIVSNWSWIHKIGLGDFFPCLVQIPSKPRCWFLGSYHAYCWFQTPPRLDRWYGFDATSRRVQGKTWLKNIKNLAYFLCWAFLAPLMKLTVQVVCVEGFLISCWM